MCIGRSDLYKIKTRLNIELHHNIGDENPRTTTTDDSKRYSDCKRVKHGQNATHVL